MRKKKTMLVVVCFVCLCVMTSSVHAQWPDGPVGHVIDTFDIAFADVRVSEQPTDISLDTTGVVLSNSVNVRSGPDLDYDQIGTIYKDQEIRIHTYHTDGWYGFDFQDGIGWVYAWFVHVEDQAVCLGVIDGTGVNVRNKPQLSAESIFVLDDQTAVAVHGRSEEWYMIEVNGTTGWVMGSYVKKIYKTIGFIKIHTDQVNVREFPDVRFDVLEKANKGDLFVTYGQYDNWYRVLLENGEDAWIHAGLANFLPYLMQVEGDYDALSVLEPPSRFDGLTVTQQLIVRTAMQYIGVPYVWGGSSPRGFDCSGFTRFVYAQFGFPMYHYAAFQANYGRHVPLGSLKPGDLVFFATSGGRYIAHVGIYIGDNRFIHASSSRLNGRQVTIDSISGYYRNVYVTARRVFDY